VASIVVTLHDWPDSQVCLGCNHALPVAEPDGQVGLSQICLETRKVIDGECSYYQQGDPYDPD
jgi:hypothetical protein